jgi:hypothetical protein
MGSAINTSPESFIEITGTVTVFACVFCQHKENADFAAAKTVKDRFFDSEIRVDTPVTEGKNILLKGIG